MSLSSRPSIAGPNGRDTEATKAGRVGLIETDRVLVRFLALYRNFKMCRIVADD